MIGGNQAEPARLDLRTAQTENMCECIDENGLVVNLKKRGLGITSWMPFTVLRSKVDAGPRERLHVHGR